MYPIWVHIFLYFLLYFVILPTFFRQLSSKVIHIIHKYKFCKNMMYQVIFLNNIEVEYVFNNNVDTTLDEILIYILKSKIRVVDFENKT